jgi:hypothetical protein
VRPMVDCDKGNVLGARMILCVSSFGLRCWSCGCGCEVVNDELS